MLIAITTVSCSNKPDPEENIKYINGFWEIKEVILPDGTSKEYGSRITIDHIEVEGKQATRKKVVPMPSGGFGKTTSEETFIITAEEDSLRFYRNTEFDSWKETVINVDADELRVRGKNGRIFVYKRYDL